MECVLVVDDEPCVLLMLKAILENEWAVETATNGHQALSMARAKHYDAILSDVRMPVMGGFEFFRRLTRDDPASRSRFIFMTAYPSDDIL